MTMSDARSQLLDAAAPLFAERGYEAVSMRDIARVLGFTQANLYYHFKDKADLIQATLEKVFEDRSVALDASLAAAPERQLEAFVHWFVQALITDKTFSRLLYRELLDGDESRIEVLSRTVLQRPFNALVAAIESDAKAVAPREFALSIVGLCLGQVLVTPLVSGLVGADQRFASAEATAARLTKLIQASMAEA
jgi:AcrR family transcriptional regulator